MTKKEQLTIEKLIEEADPDAFVTVEDARSVRRGYMHIKE